MPQGVFVSSGLIFRSLNGRVLSGALGSSMRRPLPPGGKKQPFLQPGHFLRMGERWSRLDESGLYFVPFPVLVPPKPFCLSISRS
jgi:hypothetical protein